MNHMITEFVTATGRPPEEWQADWLATPLVRPTDQVPIVLATLADRNDPDSELVPRAALAQWWLTPPFSPVLRGKYPTFNARSESVTEKPSFRAAVVSQRAVLPASGYYETQKSGPQPVPHYIAPLEGLIYFAGLYSWWKDPAADSEDPSRWHLTTTMLTQQATGALADIHDRMPVMLARDSINEWVDPRVHGDRHLVDATVAASATLSEQLHAGPRL